MHIVTSRPSAIHVRLTGRSARPASVRRQVLTAVDLVMRAFLVGIALGMLLASQGHPLISVVVPGIAAIGIALVSWDR